jgi:tRNA pseudouridine32 synthase/23S rRNA pseudouridine746 synthase
MHEFIVHADAHWVIVDKPAGLPAVPGRPQALHDCVASRVQALFGDALVVHRLDMATSGLLLLARGPDTQRTLSRAFAEREVHKQYTAIVHGVLARDEGTIDLPLAADWPRRPRQKIDLQGGKASTTHWRVLQRARAQTMLQLSPVTGRTHQLRVHLAAIGHAIVGDPLYGPAGDDTAAAPRLLLHASLLELTHPHMGVAARFESAAPFSLR